MLSDEDRARVPEWNARKLEQWERASKKMEGLQLVRSGPGKSQFMLVISTEDFYEGVLVGQLPAQLWEAFGPARQPRRRLMTEDKKPLEKRACDLGNDQIDQVLALWGKGESALNLPFVQCAWGRDGQIIANKLPSDS